LNAGTRALSLERSSIEPPRRTLRILIGRSSDKPQPRGTYWLQRALLSVLGVALAVLAFFFITVVLLLLVGVALVVGLRWWWITRRLRRSRADAAAPLEGEYVRVERDSDESRLR
jgi:hypothetical protein